MTAPLVSELVLLEPYQGESPPGVIRPDAYARAAPQMSRPDGHPGGHPSLIGRNEQLEMLTAILDGAEAGNSAALVLRGEQGIGKTALLEAISQRAALRGMITVTVGGVEVEAPIGYAALYRLLRRFPGAIDRLPSPQRDVLRWTMGLVSGPPPDRFLVGLAVLTLLADAATDAPLLTVIEDAQWLDPESATVLGFAARRLQAEGVVMLFAARERDDGPNWLSALPELVIDPLEDREATNLLVEVTSGLASPATRTRLLQEGRGNPLALIEMAGELTPEQLAGAAVLPDPLPAVVSPHQLLARRLRHLTPGARLMLGLAAAEPTASESLMWRLADRLGIDADCASLELDGLVSFDDVIRFSHPLVRSLAYYSTALCERHRIHRALAEGMDIGLNPDRVAWHHAMAATGPDEAVASQLEDAAERERCRGGYAAASRLLERAATLSVDEHLRTDRLLAASEAALAAAQPEQARALLEEVRGQPTARQAATTLRLSGEAFFAAGATDQAARELLAAARALTTIDPGLGRRALLSALIAGEFAATIVRQEVRSFAAVTSDPGLTPDDEHGVTDLFLRGFLHRLAGAAEPAARLLRQALGEMEHSRESDRLQNVIPPIVAVLGGVELLDAPAIEATAHSYAEFARRAGALTVVPNALVALATVSIRRGHFKDAETALVEAGQLRRATGARGTPDLLAAQTILLLCWRGDEGEASTQAAALLDRHERPAAGCDLVAANLALLDLSKGRYESAFSRLEAMVSEDRLGFGTYMLADFIEAAARSGRHSEAVEALDRLATRATAAGGRFGLGCLARCRALVADDNAAEEHHRQSIDLLDDNNSATELARSRLLFGEWLRRQRRRRDARSELKTAHEMFVRMGASGFAERTRIELLATGEKVRKHIVEAATHLTPQESQIAGLVAKGHTNREVAAKLFISAATVDYHLRKVFQKLGVSSRTQLAREVALGKVNCVPGPIG
jgi:DNA-binding CsgD family transcriptional regulator